MEIVLFLCLFFSLTVYSKSTPKLIGHRGYSGKYTENTIKSMTKAYSSGFDGVEMDIWEAKDHTIWVFHDEDLKDLTGKSGKIWDLKYKKRASYKLKDGTVIPTLDEMLKKLRLKKQIFIHIKGNYNRKLTQVAKNSIVSTIKKYHLENQIYIFSGKNMMCDPNADFGEIKTGWLVFKTDPEILRSRIREAKEKKVNFILLYEIQQYKSKGNGAAFISYAHKNGIKTGLYWTKTHSDYNYLSKVNADFALSNNYVK